MSCDGAVRGTVSQRSSSGGAEEESNAVGRSTFEDDFLATDRRTVSPFEENVLVTDKRSASPFKEDDFVTGRRTVSPFEENVLITDKRSASPFKKDDFVTGRRAVSPFVENVLVTGKRSASPFKEDDFVTGKRTASPFKENVLVTDKRSASPFKDDFVTDRRTASPIKENVLVTDKRSASPFKDDFVTGKSTASPFKENSHVTNRRSTSPLKEDDFVTGRRTASSFKENVLVTDRRFALPLKEDDFVTGRRTASPFEDSILTTGRRNAPLFDDDDFVSDRMIASPFEDDDFVENRRIVSPFEDYIFATGQRTGSPSEGSALATDRKIASPFKDEDYVTVQNTASPLEDDPTTQGLLVSRPGIEGYNDDNIELRYSPSPSPSPAFYDRYRALFGDDDWNFAPVLPLRRPDLDKVKYHTTNAYDALNLAIRRRKFHENNSISPLTIDSTFILVCRALSESQSEDDLIESGKGSQTSINSPRNASNGFLDIISIANSFQDENEALNVSKDNLQNTPTAKLSKSDESIKIESMKEVSNFSPKCGKTVGNSTTPVSTTNETLLNRLRETPPKCSEKVPPKFTKSSECSDNQRKSAGLDDSDQPEVNTSPVSYIHREVTDKGKTSSTLRQKFASLSTVPLLGIMPCINTAVKNDSKVGTKSPVPSKSASVSTCELAGTPRTGSSLLAAHDAHDKEIPMEARLCKADDTTKNPGAQTLPLDIRKINNCFVDTKTPPLNQSKGIEDLPNKNLQKRNVIKKGSDIKAPWICSKENHKNNVLTKKVHRVLDPPQQKKWKTVSTVNRPPWNSNKVLPKIPNSTNGSVGEKQSTKANTHKISGKPHSPYLNRSGNIDRKLEETKERNTISDTVVLPAMKNKNTRSGTTTLPCITTVHKRNPSGISALPKINTVNKRNASSITVLPAIKKASKGSTTVYHVPDTQDTDLANNINIGDVINKKRALPPIPSNAALENASGNSIR